MKRSDTTRASRSSLLVRAALLLALGLGIPATSLAQDAGSSPPAQTEQSRLSIRGSVGFAASPEMFQMTVEAPWVFNDIVSVGPLFQLGFSDDDTLFAPTVQVYFNPRLGGELDALRPYGHMGMGLVYLENDDRAPGRDDKDVDFLFTIGLGVEYALREDFLVGTGMLFNVIPTGAVGQNFVFGWQLLMFRYAF